MKKEELLIYMRIENLLNRVYPALKNFPKSEKYALSQDIRHLFLEYLSLIDQASCVKSKRFEFAQEAQGCLNTIKAAFSIAVRQKFIWRGHASHADAHNFTRQLMEKNKFIVMQNKSQGKVALKIETRAL